VDINSYLLACVVYLGLTADTEENKALKFAGGRICKSAALENQICGIPVNSLEENRFLIPQG
jgi:hypothetical protein